MATTRKPPARRARTGAAPRTRTAAPRGARKRAEEAPRDSQGRFKPDHHVRNAAVGAAAAIGAVAAGVAAAFRFGLLDRFLPAREGHDAEDLLIASGDAADPGARPGNGDRAPAAFRPDIDAPMTRGEREALRPARGTPAADLAGADNGAVETV